MFESRWVGLAMLRRSCSAPWNLLARRNDYRLETLEKLFLGLTVNKQDLSLLENSQAWHTNARGNPAVSD